MASRANSPRYPQPPTRHETQTCVLKLCIQTTLELLTEPQPQNRSPSTLNDDCLPANVGASRLRNRCRRCSSQPETWDSKTKDLLFRPHGLARSKATRPFAFYLFYHYFALLSFLFLFSCTATLLSFQLHLVSHICHVSTRAGASLTGRRKCILPLSQVLGMDRLPCRLRRSCIRILPPIELGTKGDPKKNEPLPMIPTWRVGFLAFSTSED